MTEMVVLKKLQCLMIDLMTKLDAIFSKNLVTIRKASGYASAESFAEALGISLRALQRYESGDRMPSSEKIEQIAEKLGREPQDFFRTEEGRVRVLPVSEMVKRLVCVPDDIYDLAMKVKLDDSAWDTVRSALEIAIERPVKQSKHSSQA